MFSEYIGVIICAGNFYVNLLNVVIGPLAFARPLPLSLSSVEVDKIQFICDHTVVNCFMNGFLKFRKTFDSD
jgi:hypothetical protein